MKSTVISNIRKVSSYLQYLDRDTKNIVIGGSSALVLHGLFVKQEPEDLDIIVFRPTKTQKEHIKVLQKTFGTEDIGSDNLRRSYKIRVNDKLTVDFILAHDIDIPENMVSVNVDGYNYYINSVCNIIEAIACYKRPKDFEKAWTLKQLNFNI
jgi:hypothetical protein